MTKNLNAYEIQTKLNINTLTIRAYSEAISKAKAKEVGQFSTLSYQVISFQ